MCGKAKHLGQAILVSRTTAGVSVEFYFFDLPLALWLLSSDPQFLLVDGVVFILHTHMMTAAELNETTTKKTTMHAGKPGGQTQWLLVPRYEPHRSAWTW